MSGKKTGRWLGRLEAAEMLGISDRHFDRIVRPAIPKAAQRRVANRPEFLSSAVVAAWRDVSVQPAKHLVGETDPLLAGTGDESPREVEALEQYRRAKARLAELELAERTRELVSRAELRDWSSRLAARLRQAGEQLMKHHGEGAYRILERAIDDAASMETEL